jgi:signal transduction histidine kinase
MRKVALILVLSIFVCSATQAQGKESQFAEMKHFDSLLLQNHLQPNAYLDSIVAVGNIYLSQGKTFDNAELKQQLRLFKEYAFDRLNSYKYQVQYYLLLANNAQWHGRDGESLYYYDRIEALNQAEKKDLLRVPARKMQYYGGAKALYPKGKAQYFRSVRTLDSIVELICSGKIKRSGSATELYFINASAFIFSQLGDSLVLNKLAAQSKRLKKAYATDSSITGSEQATVIFLANMSQLYKEQFVTRRYRKALQLLDSTFSEILAVTDASDPWAQMAAANMYNSKVLIYSSLNQQDSARFYLQKIFGNSIVSGDHQFNELMYISGLDSGAGNFKSAYLNLKQAFDLQQELYYALKAEHDETTYAFVEAEETRERLSAANEQSRNRAIVILVISLLSAAVLLWLTASMKKREKKSKDQIDTINYQAAIQIAEIEKSKMELQEGIGKDIHDTLASQIAGIRNRVALLAMNQDSRIDTTELDPIIEVLDAAYESARRKSHDLVDAGASTTDKNFEQQLRKLLDLSLPDNYYQKEVAIDDGVADLLEPDQKIELIKIVQESVTNIIKHAKASKVSMLAYLDGQSIYFVISDNGKGNKAGKWKEGIGLQSITERARKIGAAFTIDKNDSGTSLNFEITR